MKLRVLLGFFAVWSGVALWAQTPPLPVVSPLPPAPAGAGLAPLPGAAKSAVNEPNRLVDGVELPTFQLIQKLLVEEAASNSEVASLDLQIEQLRERRAELCFKAVQQANPELKPAIKAMQNKQTERMQQDKATAQEAKRATKKKS